jgi:hypothetical protein
MKRKRNRDRRGFGPTTRVAYTDDLDAKTAWAIDQADPLRGNTCQLSDPDESEPFKDDGGDPARTPKPCEHLKTPHGPHYRRLVRLENRDVNSEPLKAYVAELAEQAAVEFEVDDERLIFGSSKRAGPALDARRAIVHKLRRTIVQRGSGESRQYAERAELADLTGWKPLSQPVIGKLLRINHSTVHLILKPPNSQGGVNSSP